VRAAIYARYSSENQRPESITDQIASCRRLAVERGYQVDGDRIFTDEAASGARQDREGLAALRRAAEGRCFDVVLVDDLSRLARNTLLMLSVMEELRFHGIRVVSVADGLDTHDEESTVGIQVRGIFNELQLSDLRKKTLRGQIGQKMRGFVVGEATFGYRSVPVGTVRMDKKGRPRPEGYRMVLEPREAAVVLRIFREFADGRSESAIVRSLNAEAVPGRLRARNGWSPSTVHRILRNEKYAGRWIWNRMETRRDPKTGRRRQFPKPESEWIVHEDESLRIVPAELWTHVQERLQAVRQFWPGAKGTRGFEGKKGSVTGIYPTDLLAGAMECGLCGAAIAKVSGKSGGYYGCLGAAKGTCTNRQLVRRAVAERVILAGLREKLASTENLRYIFERVSEEVDRASARAPEEVRLKEAELEAELRRIRHFVEFIAEGRGSRALADALAEAERRAASLTDDLEAIRQAQAGVPEVPPAAWIEERVATLQQVLERHTEKSALLLRKVLGRIRLEPVQPDIGRPYLRAVSKLQVLSLLEIGPVPGSPDTGSSHLRWWRRWESNPRPENASREHLRA